MNMSEQEYVQILNNCNETITVYIRFPRPKKKSAKHTKSFSLTSREKSYPLPVHFLIGA